VTWKHDVAEANNSTTTTNITTTTTKTITDVFATYALQLRNQPSVNCSDIRLIHGKHGLLPLTWVMPSRFRNNFHFSASVFLLLYILKAALHISVSRSPTPGGPLRSVTACLPDCWLVVSVGLKSIQTVWPNRAPTNFRTPHSEKWCFFLVLGTFPASLSIATSIHEYCSNVRYLIEVHTLMICRNTNSKPSLSSKSGAGKKQGPKPHIYIKQGPRHL